jgi:ribonuclease J
VALLLADSTNAEEPGFTPSESSVGSALRRLFLERPNRRMVVACFASHIHRIQQISNVAHETGRKIAFMGRSMEANVKLARKLHLLKVDSADIIDVENISRFAPGEVCVVCTGSQGEPLAVLSRLSRGDARNFKVGADDTIILSSHPIPGNEWSVGRVIDDLHREATEVIDSSQEPIHASGHARQGELRTFQQLLRPKNFVPVHGEYRHLVHHAELAVSMGLSPRHVLICEDGDQIEVSEKGIRRAGKVPAGFHYIDGNDGDFDERPLEERRMLAEYGVLLVSAGVDRDLAKIAQPVTVSARGWFEGASDADVIVHITTEVRNALHEAIAEGNLDGDSLSKIAQRAAGRLLGQRYRRQPVILSSVLVF